MLVEFLHDSVNFLFVKNRYFIDVLSNILLYVAITSSDILKKPDLWAFQLPLWARNN